MFTIAIDCGDQRPKGRAALAGDLLQAVQELVLRLTLVLWPAMTIERLETEDFTAFSPPQMSHRN
jgi:hypothetical protein